MAKLMAWAVILKFGLTIGFEVDVISLINLYLPAESAILPCNYTSINRSVPVDIKWFYIKRSQESVIMRWTYVDGIGDEKYDISSKHGNCSLRIHKPWLDDSGNYSVTVQAHNQDYVQGVVQLIVSTSLVTSENVSEGHDKTTIMSPTETNPDVIAGMSSNTDITQSDVNITLETPGLNGTDAGGSQVAICHSLVILLCVIALHPLVIYFYLRRSMNKFGAQKLDDMCAGSEENSRGNGTLTCANSGGFLEHGEFERGLM